MERKTVEKVVAYESGENVIVRLNCFDGRVEYFTISIETQKPGNFVGIIANVTKINLLPKMVIDLVKTFIEKELCLFEYLEYFKNLGISAKYINTECFIFEEN